MTAARRLTSPGPIAEGFTRSRAFICGIVGPVGSGKTMAALQKGIRVGALQKGKIDDKGVTWRKARIGVIRESYPSLESTTLKSWFNIVPESEGKFSWRAPYTHTFRKILRRQGNQRDGHPIDVLDITFEFRAIGQQTVEEACRGWEVNAVIVDEADLQPEDLVPFLTGRVGRGGEDLDPAMIVDPQIILSLNMPDIDNHAYRLLLDRELVEMSEEDKASLEAALNGRPLIEAFVQPGGRHRDAENLHNLPGGRGYYVLQVAANRHKPGYVDRMVDNKPVPLQHGKPVNANFLYTDHVRPLAWNPRRKLILGVDQGLYAAAVALQRTTSNQIRTLGEVVNLDDKGKSLRKVSAKAFGKRVKLFLTERFPGLEPDMIRVVIDPAAFGAPDREDSDEDWALAFQAALGLKVYKAKSNRQGLRNEVIWQAHDERDGYAVDPSAKHLIKAHVGGYRYQKATLATGEVRGELEIQNTIYTHVADAEQYAALEGEHVIGDIRGKARTPRVVKNISDYDVLGGI